MIDATGGEVGEVNTHTHTQGGKGGMQDPSVKEKVGWRITDRRLIGGLLVRRTGTRPHYLCTYVLFTPCVGDAGSWAKPSGTGDAG